MEFTKMINKSGSVEVTSARLRFRYGRKRNKIADAEKVIAVRQLLEDPDGQLASFTDRYVSLKPITKGHSTKTIVKRKCANSNVEAMCGYLRNITSKSMAWKFQIAVKFIELDSSNNPEVNRYLIRLRQLAKQAQDGVRIMETKFVDQNKLERYDDKFKRRLDLRSRL
jgi:hypothetical protein